MGQGAENLARQQWVSACAFELCEQSDIKPHIINKIKDNMDLGVRSYVLLDLDSTLYEVAPRTVRILQDAALALALPDSVRSALAGLKAPGAGYSLDDTWKNLGLCLQDPELGQARARLHAAWRRGFFSNTYLDHDVVYPGAREFAGELHALGAELVYLTGRDAPAMREGTLRCLERDGFPLDARTQLRMKAHRDIDDIDHKLGVASGLMSSGNVVASFENEPRNFAALFRELPHAIHVFVNTVCSDKPAPVVRGAYQIRRQPILT